MVWGSVTHKGADGFCGACCLLMAARCVARGVGFLALAPQANDGRFVGARGVKAKQSRMSNVIIDIPIKP